jgi:MYXO-CTERM domain-containing protein
MSDINVSSARRRALAAALVGLAGLAGTAIPGDAHACGGLFCNGPPPNPFAPLPVAQNGENVVFAITKDPNGGASTMEAHIQILYTGDAAKFSWVVPVDAEPVLSTGTDRLFTALANVTAPNFFANYVTDGDCIQSPYPPPQAAPGGTFTTGSAGTTGAAGTGGGNAVQVSFQGAVGPFDAAVIKSDDPMALKMWLTDNGYVVTDSASALIDVYVRENKYFVALKLLNGKDVRQIQPIVLTFKGTEACVPLRLTAIAANPDMPVLVWVLGQTRVAPRQFYELSIDEARIDWRSGGSNYFGPKGLLSQAANEAGGNAFITEYAGTTAVAFGSVFQNGQINLDTLKSAMTPPVYVSALVSMGLANDPLVLPLLAKYIPMPDAVKAMGVTEVQFYGNIQMYWNTFAFPPFDLAGLTAEIEKSIYTPRLKAQMMVDSHGYMTRLNTFISPEEMTKDPFFFETQDLPDLSNLHQATIRTMCGNRQYMSCNAPQRLELQDGRQLWLRSGVGKGISQCLPAKPGENDDLADLPAAHVVYERELVGDGMVITDNSQRITAGVNAHNKKFTAEEAMAPTPTDPTGAAGSGGSGTAGTSGISNGGGGCGCSLSDARNEAPVFAALGILFGVVVARRRRSR